MKRALSICFSVLLILTLCACHSQPKQNSVLGPETILETALNKSPEEVESALEVTFSEENRNTATGGYVFPCGVTFGEQTAGQVELQFAQEKLSAAMYTFSDIQSPEEGWEFLKKLSQTMGTEGRKSAMEDLYGQSSSFERYDSYDAFSAAAEEQWDSNPLPAEAMDLYYVGDHAQCQLSLAVSQEGVFSTTVTYSEIRWDGVS